MDITIQAIDWHNRRHLFALEFGCFEGLRLVATILSTMLENSNAACALGDPSVDDAVTYLLLAMIVGRFDGWGKHETKVIF